MKATKKTRKIIALDIVLVMLLAIIPMTASASDASEGYGDDYQMSATSTDVSTYTEGCEYDEYNEPDYTVCENAEYDENQESLPYYGSHGSYDYDEPEHMPPYNELHPDAFEPVPPYHGFDDDFLFWTPLYSEPFYTAETTQTNSGFDPLMTISATNAVQAVIVGEAIAPIHLSAQNSEGYVIFALLEGALPPGLVFTGNTVSGTVGLMVNPGTFTLTFIGIDLENPAVIPPQATITIEVAPQGTQPASSGSDFDMQVGETRMLEVVASSANLQLILSSSNPNVATVEANSPITITAVGPGDATIQIMTFGASPASLRLTVSVQDDLATQVGLHSSHIDSTPPPETESASQP
ncbi:MAG: hypothetical protein FWB97_04685 [Oscillospiraceae bacterium]|nr:hypothetical protein [Oscillospiraceae bacterium]